MSWINLGGHYINMAQIVDVITDETRINWTTYAESRKPEPCIIFIRPVTQIGEHNLGGSEEIIFFGEQRDAILKWLFYNPLAIEAANIVSLPAKVVGSSPEPEPEPDLEHSPLDNF